MISKFCLVLNKHWKPIGFCSVYHGITKMLSNRAVMLDVPSYCLLTGDEWMSVVGTNLENCILTTRGRLVLPEIIITKFYDRYNYRDPRCSKHNLLKRDGMICQYTGEFLVKKNATIDHILPKSKGGKTTWNNCVVSSFFCNNRKGSKTLNEVNLKLLIDPKKPTWGLRDYIPNNIQIPNSWEYFLGEKNH